MLAVVGGAGQGNGGVRVIGIGLAIAVLLKTFVVRTVLVPSVVALLDRWNWWPSHIGQTVALKVDDADPSPYRADGDLSLGRSVVDQCVSPNVDNIRFDRPSLP